MAVQVGTTYNYKREIILDYVCSYCGTHNQARDTLTTSVFTSALIRVDPNTEANNTFNQTIKQLNKGPVPERYLDTGIYCRCSNCQKAEPWALLYSTPVNTKLLWIPLILTMLLSVTTEAIPAGLPKLLVLASGAIPYLALVIKKAIRRNKILKEISALPVQSLPVVSFAQLNLFI